MLTKNTLKKFGAENLRVKSCGYSVNSSTVLETCSDSRLFIALGLADMEHVTAAGHFHEGTPEIIKGSAVTAPHWTLDLWVLFGTTMEQNHSEG